jgi:hypothetical protein
MPISEGIEYHLELMAEAEHDGWMQWHFDRGWRYDAKRDNDRKLHNCLLPDLRLDDVERNKDRDTIRLYPDFARAAENRIALRSS